MVPDQPVVDASIELSGKKKHVTSLIKDLQPHREKPSKDRAKIFATGDIASDLPVPDHHDLQEFQYWAILPLVNELRAAKLFIVGQIVYISEGDNHCRSASSKNPNVCLIFLSYKYLPECKTYTIAGKFGLCSAKSPPLKSHQLNPRNRKRQNYYFEPNA